MRHLAIHCISGMKYQIGTRGLVDVSVVPVIFARCVGGSERIPFCHIAIFRYSPLKLYGLHK